MSASTVYRSELGVDIARYITGKRALGRDYVREQNILRHLDHFLAECEHRLCPQTFAVWCVSIGHLSPTVRRNWMRVARNLCLYRRRSNPECFVPDTSGFPSPHQTECPHLFTQADIARLLRTSDELRPGSSSPLHREVVRLAVVLLYTAGLRRGELIRLTIADYDAAERTLTIRASKFHKSRLVPISTDAARELEGFLKVRQRYPMAAEAPLLYNNHTGSGGYTGAGLAQALRRLYRRAGIRTRTGALPRIHDLRHSFAYEVLRQWYQADVDLQAKLPALATYMGHVSVASTQYYLTLFGPFAEAAGERYERHCRPFLGDTPQGGDA